MYLLKVENACYMVTLIYKIQHNSVKTQAIFVLLTVDSFKSLILKF